MNPEFHTGRSGDLLFWSWVIWQFSIVSPFDTVCEIVQYSYFYKLFDPSIKKALTNPCAMYLWAKSGDSHSFATAWMLKSCGCATGTCQAWWSFLQTSAIRGNPQTKIKKTHSVSVLKYPTPCSVFSPIFFSITSLIGNAFIMLNYRLQERRFEEDDKLLYCQYDSFLPSTSVSVYSRGVLSKVNSSWKRPFGNSTGLISCTLCLSLFQRKALFGLH